MQATRWRIPVARLDALLERVGRAVPDADTRDDLVARAFWHVVAEPGDAAVGLLADADALVAGAQAMIMGCAPGDLVTLTAGELDGDAAASALRRWTPRVRADDVVRALEIAGSVHARLLTPLDDAWPDGLVRLGPHRPHLLWVRGRLDLAPKPGVALVGARAATGYGEHVAMELSAGLASRDVVVISGGAYGIDGAAHRAALASQGDTIAVLAGGADRLYPSGHDALLRRVIEQGAVISETPCGTAPTRWRFLQRNRIIAAMSDAVVVVEAGHRSGALNTVHHALSAGVPVGVVPGPITSAASAGCHRVLRSSEAMCITSTTDIVELAYGSPTVTEDAVLTAPSSPGATRVRDALRPRRAQSIDELARSTGMAPHEVRAELGLLEFEQLAIDDGDGRWRKAARPRRDAQEF